MRSANSPNIWAPIYLAQLRTLASVQVADNVGARAVQQRIHACRPGTSGVFSGAFMICHMHFCGVSKGPYMLARSCEEYLGQQTACDTHQPRGGSPLGICRCRGAAMSATGVGKWGHCESSACMAHWFRNGCSHQPIPSVPIPAMFLKIPQEVSASKGKQRNRCCTHSHLVL